MSLEMAHKVILPPKKNYIPQFLKQRDINSYCLSCICKNLIILGEVRINKSGKVTIIYVQCWTPIWNQIWMILGLLKSH
jgi:hypothetical protein